MVDVRAAAVEELGGQHDVLAAALQRPSNNLFGVVDVGGVDEVDPGIEGGRDDAHRHGVIGGGSGAEVHRAQR